MLELVVVIAILGVLLTVVVGMVGKQPIAVKNAKLTSDVATLNQMVATYVSDGGSMTGVTNAQAVLDKLKRTRPQADWKKHTGHASGRLVDVRLRARITTTPEVAGQERARWDSKTMRFIVTSAATGSAVSEFYLDDSLSTLEPAPESRTAPVVAYNSSTGKNQGWVWGDSAAGTATYNAPGSNSGDGTSRPFDPGADAPTDPGPTDPGTGGNPGNGGGSGNPSNPKPTALLAPGFNPAGGRYAYNTFPSAVTLVPRGTSGTGTRMEYQLNNGAWQPYTGPIAINPSDKITARTFAVDTELYTTSGTSSSTYYRLASNFAGSSTATWGNATGGSNLVTSVENGTASSSFKHGNTKQDLGNGVIAERGIENVLTFTPAEFEEITPNTWFDLGSLMMLNGTTFYNSEADGVTLSVNMKMTQPALNTTVHINLGLISTENTEDRLASADIVELRNPTTDMKVTVDGIAYRLELSWTTLDAGAGVVQGNQFLIYEGATANAALRARFVPL